MIPLLMVHHTDLHLNSFRDSLKEAVTTVLNDLDKPENTLDNWIEANLDFYTSAPFAFGLHDIDSAYHCLSYYSDAIKSAMDKLTLIVHKLKKYSR